MFQDSLLSQGCEDEKKFSYITTEVVHMLSKICDIFAL